MFFSIQASMPRIRHVDETPLSLLEATELSFVSNTEDAFVNWNGIRVPLSYKHDLPHLIDDLLDMLEALSEPFGVWHAFFPSNTFRVSFKLRWTPQILRVRATWEATTAGLVELLNANQLLESTPQQFASEWRELIRVLVGAFDKSTLTTPGTSRLLRWFGATSQLERGLLYQPEPKC